MGTSHDAIVPTNLPPTSPYPDSININPSVISISTDQSWERTADTVPAVVQSVACIVLRARVARLVACLRSQHQIEKIRLRLENLRHHHNLRHLLVYWVGGLIALLLVAQLRPQTKMNGRQIKQLRNILPIKQLRNANLRSYRMHLLDCMHCLVDRAGFGGRMNKTMNC